MDFDDALLAAGIDPGGIDVRQLETWQRVPTTDKPRKRNGSVLMFESNPPCGYIKNWATGFIAVGGGKGWLDRPKVLTIHQSVAKVEHKEHPEVAERTRLELETLKPASPSHHYLQHKQISPHGALRKFDELIIPMQTTDGTVWSYQRIKPDGTKLFKKSGRTHGCYFQIGLPVGDKLLVCEGFSTGATLHEVCGFPVAVAFSAQNLPAVARHLHHAFPEVEIVIAADNDAGINGNPGLKYGIDAAKQCGGFVVYPTFGSAGRIHGYSDWNDVHCAYGRDLVREQVVGMMEVYT